MTAPRQVLSGSTYLVTRRCSERRFFLRPSAQTNAIFRYVLAAIAERYEILLHAFCVLSNHYHLVLTDPHGRLPEFHRDLDGLVARAMNRLLGRRESFWDPDSYSAVRLEDPGAVLAKVAYVLANPVAAGLVRRASEWPGLWSDPELIGGEAAVRVERPRGFFRDAGPMPASATLQLHRPPGFEADSRFSGTVRDLLREAEASAAADQATRGLAFLGVARVLAQRPGAAPREREPLRGLVPRIATRDRWRRVEALLRLAGFARAYREALEAWRTGVRDVLFPAGTWLMRVQHGAQCAGS